MIMIYQQFYFTNYGDEQRFAAASTGSHKAREDMLLLSARWFDMSSETPSISVLYNTHLNAYVAALMRDVSGDQAPRKNIWVHAVVPEATGREAFEACLAWPAEYFNPEINLHASLEPVSPVEETAAPTGAAPENGFHPGRLEALLTQVFEALLSEDGVLRFRLPVQSADLGTCYGQAAQIMQFISQMVPDRLGDRLSFTVGEAQPSFGIKFLFKKDFDSTSCYDLRQPPERVPDQFVHGAMSGLAALLTEDPAAFKKRVNDAYADGSADMDRFLLSCYLQAVLQGEEIRLPQSKTEEILPAVEENERRDPRWARLRCRMLSMLDLQGKTEAYLRAVLEKYITAAANIYDRQCREYKASFDDIKHLLDEYCRVSGTDRKIYMNWMQENFPDYYIAYCQKDPDVKLTRAVDEDFRTVQTEAGKENRQAAEQPAERKDTERRQAYDKAWLPAAAAGAGTGFLAGCIFDMTLSAAAAGPVRLIIAGAVCILGILVKLFTDKYR